MTKNSKKLKIPSPTLSVKGRIPDHVALIAESEQTYVIAFSHYNEDLCEIDNLEKNISKECLHDLKRISKSTIGGLAEKGIDRIRINKSGEYKKLYNKLPDPNIELFEHKIQGTSRLFYFTAKNKFCIVAIKNSHFETDKVRR